MSDRVLIFGGSGMLGHKLGQIMSKRLETHVTLRDRALAERYPQIFRATSVIDGVDVLDAETVVRAFSIAKPTVVINAVGVVKQLDSSKNAITSISINSLFPHKLAELCAKKGARLITISTDCVFSGERGNYAETDRPDPEDMYGQSKLLGEVQTGNCLTIRTSIIGRQIQG
ncbi:MAG: sugar nucleotide-binding protein, partial [Leptolyngbya sp.]|nr:sugar nucleotide-binding protein [Candidatus Melainabacteria bacterium]